VVGRKGCFDAVDCQSALGVPGAGVIDQYIQPIETTFKVSRHLTDRFLRAKIAYNQLHRRACRRVADLVSRLFTAASVAADKDDSEALCGKRQGRFFADPGSCAGDETCPLVHRTRSLFDPTHGPFAVFALYSKKRAIIDSNEEGRPADNNNFRLRALAYLRNRQSWALPWRAAVWLTEFAGFILRFRTSLTF
jgi:hypothetical protein